MAAFEIIDSRQLGTDRCEFDVVRQSGEPVLGEIFSIKETGSVWEFVILSVARQTNFLTLGCANWIPESGAFVGTVVTTRALSAAARKRYAKVLPASLG